LPHTSNDTFVLCAHEANKKDWAPMQNGVLKLHPYCNKCGTMKNVSSDKGKKISYFVASLSKLRKILEKRGYKISDTQIWSLKQEAPCVRGCPIIPQFFTISSVTNNLS